MAIPFEKSSSSLLTAEWIPMPKNDNADGAATAQITPPRSGLVGFAPSLIFGGYIEEGEETLVRSVTNDLWRWDPTSGRWSIVIKPSDEDSQPGPRLVAAGAVLDDKAYLIGGWDPGATDGGGILDDVHVLDLLTNTWSAFPQSFPDGPTSRHVALPLKGCKKIWIHNHRCASHVYLLDPIQQSIAKQPTTGIPPSGRGLHAAVMTRPTRIILFGGAAQDGIMSNEVFCLNLETWEWNPIKIIGPDLCPTPRAGPCMATLDDHCVLVFGGAERTQEGGLRARGDLWALHVDEDYQSGQWELLLDDTVDDKAAEICIPPPRNGAVLMEQLTPQSQTKDFLLTGGWAPFIQTWSDTFLLRIHRQELKEE